MSGLLVKSTLIMRENLEELNARGLADRVPVLLGGAALTRTYVERDLREVYDGRVFYGKDAFEGLRTMDTLIQGRTNGTLDPTFGREPGGRNLPPRKSQQPVDGTIEVPGALRRRDRHPGLHAAVRRLARRQGHLARRDRRLRQRDRAVPQPVAVPARVGRARRRLQGADPARRCAPSSTIGQAGRPARSGRGVGLLRGEQRRQRPRRVEGRHPHPGMAALPLPAPTQGAVPVDRRLLPSGRVGRDRLRGVPRRDDGTDRQRARRSCSRPTSTRTTCCCTACRSR